MSKSKVRERKFAAAMIRANGVQKAAALMVNPALTPASAEVIGSRLAARPDVQAFMVEALDRAGQTPEQLAAIHTGYLNLHTSNDIEERRLGLAALRLAYQVRGYLKPSASPVTPPELSTDGLARIVDVLRELKGVGADPAVRARDITPSR